MVLNISWSTAFLFFYWTWVCLGYGIQYPSIFMKQQKKKMAKKSCNSFIPIQPLPPSWFTGIHRSIPILWMGGWIHPVWLIKLAHKQRFILLLLIKRYYWHIPQSMDASKCLKKREEKKIYTNTYHVRRFCYNGPLQ